MTNEYNPDGKEIRFILIIQSYNVVFIHVVVPFLNINNYR